MIFKPNGCSASTGPNVSSTVLSHPENRYQLVTSSWAEIEPRPDEFTFSSLQNKINTVKSYRKKYALVVNCGGPGSPAWLIDRLGAPYLSYVFRGTTTYRLPLWWDAIVLARLQSMIERIGQEYSNDTSLALVYVAQMTSNGNEGHLLFVNMDTMYARGFTQARWIDAAVRTTRFYAAAFPDKPLAFEVHDVDGTTEIPKSILYDLFNDRTLCRRVGVAMWWLSGKDSYQAELLKVIRNFPGDKYAQIIAASNEPTRFQDSSIASAFSQAKQIGIRYIEPWFFEYQNKTIDSLLRDFNFWSDTTFTQSDTCTIPLRISEESQSKPPVIDVYPNPASGIVNIVLKNSRESMRIRCNDLFGRILYARDVDEPSAQINLQHFPRAMYLLRIETESRVFYKKILLRD